MKLLPKTGIAIFILLSTFLPSCRKIDWKFWEKEKHSAFYSIFDDCSVKRVYGVLPEGEAWTQFNKEYNSRGLVKSLSYSTDGIETADSTITFYLRYNPITYTVDFFDPSDRLVFKVFFNTAGKIIEARGIEAPETFANMVFEYDGDRLSRIHWDYVAFENDIQTLTYNSDGNIIKSVFLRVGETDEETSHFRTFLTYGAATPGKTQFYTELTPLGVRTGFAETYTSLGVLEMLGWIKEFSPKNLLVRSEFLWGPESGGGGDIIAHEFDAEGKLIHWGPGVNLEWVCPSSH